MFVGPEQVPAGQLVQGDIVADVPLFGCLDEQKTHRGGETAWMYEGRLQRGYCAVLSHSCEIAPENGMKVTSCILAPLRRADKTTTPEQFEILKNSNVVTPGAAYHLKYFYLPPHPSIPGFEAGSVIDFSKLFSLHKSMVEALASRRVAQMNSETALSMARKLAAYFYRSA